MRRPGDGLATRPGDDLAMTVRGGGPAAGAVSCGVSRYRSHETQLEWEEPPVVTHSQPWESILYHDRDQGIAVGAPIGVFESPELSAKALEINWRSFEYYPSLDRIKRYTEEHYQEEIPLPCAAEVAGMEATYFSAFFRKKIGIRYTDWLACLRVAHAIRLLKSRDQPIAEIAQAVGFNDLRTFERAFKRVTHTTARRFKERVRPA
jgi:AraC-like DNA-binding protein